MGHRREHRRAELVRLGVELGDPRPGVQPRAVERGGGLLRAAASSNSCSLGVNGRCPTGRSTLRVPNDTGADHQRDTRVGPAGRHASGRDAARVQLAAVQLHRDLALRQAEGFQQHAAKSSSTRSGTSPVNSFVERYPSNRASRSRREARARSSRAARPGGPPRAPPRGTRRRSPTSSVPSKRSLNRGVHRGAGSAIEDRIAGDAGPPTALPPPRRSRSPAGTGRSRPRARLGAAGSRPLRRPRARPRRSCRRGDSGPATAFGAPARPRSVPSVPRPCVSAPWPSRDLHARGGSFTPRSRRSTTLWTGVEPILRIKPGGRTDALQLARPPGPVLFRGRSVPRDDVATATVGLGAPRCE